ncbi:Cytochrome P450 4C1, partial [Pseudolycoriella hygida]
MVIYLVVFLVFVLSTLPILQWYKKRVKMSEIINKIPGKKSYPWFGPFPDIVIRKAEFVEKVISSTKNMAKSKIYVFMGNWLGDGLLTSNGGNKWLMHRKIITPTFHFSILENFCEIFHEKSLNLVKKLNEKAAAGETFNIHSLITHTALDIISEAAMGISLDVQGKQRKEYVNSVYEISELLLHRWVRPYLHPEFIYKRTATGRRFHHCMKVLHSFTNEVIENRKKTREANKQENVPVPKRKAFLDLILDANENQNILTDQDIREEVDTFMFAGHDTTAAGISWTLYMLGMHPDIQEKVFDEISFIFNGTDRAATLGDLNEMKYLERVIKETMRILPSVPTLGRILKKSVLSSIIRNFKVAAIDKREDLFLMRELILKSFNGINVKLEKRVK